MSKSTFMSLSGGFIIAIFLFVMVYQIIQINILFSAKKINQDGFVTHSRELIMFLKDLVMVIVFFYWKGQSPNGNEYVNTGCSKIDCPLNLNTV